MRITMSNLIQFVVLCLFFCAAANAGPEQRYADILIGASKQHHIPVALIIEVIKAESNFDNRAVSEEGAKGLMQLMDETAKAYNASDSFDSEENINVGTAHLKALLHHYQSVELALAAYNAGKDAVDKYGGVPPYPETRNYIEKIDRGYFKRTGQHLTRKNGR